MGQSKKIGQTIKGFLVLDSKRVNQANNRRNNRIIEFEGNRYTLSQLADKVGLTQATVKQRYENGWSIEDIVRTPHRSRKKWSEMQCS